MQDVPAATGYDPRMPPAPVLVFGASGHTGRFVVDELARRGIPTVIAGRDLDKLAAMRTSASTTILDARATTIDDPASLDRALRGCGIVLNCAGPFLDTAQPVLDAALRAGAHYLDVTAEQSVVRSIFDQLAGRTELPIAVIPAMAFYGGLADLLATVAMADHPTADEISVIVGLDHWHPTAGSRDTGKRNTAPRVIFDHGAFVPVASPPTRRAWSFPAPLGTQDIITTPLTEIITIAHHLRATRIEAFLNATSLAEIRDPSTPTPTATDDRGRSAQTFVMDVVVRTGDRTHGVRARGRDIYAFTAPLLVEATERLRDGRFTRTGAASPGEIFDAADFLRALSPELTVERL